MATSGTRGPGKTGTGKTGTRRSTRAASARKSTRTTTPRVPSMAKAPAPAPKAATPAPEPVVEASKTAVVTPAAPKPAVPRPVAAAPAKPRAAVGADPLALMTEARHAATASMMAMNHEMVSFFQDWMRGRMDATVALMETRDAREAMEIETQHMQAMVKASLNHARVLTELSSVAVRDTAKPLNSFMTTQMKKVALPVRL